MNHNIWTIFGRVTIKRLKGKRLLQLPESPWIPVYSELRYNYKPKSWSHLMYQGYLKDSKYYHIRITIRRRVTMTFRAHRSNMLALSHSRSLVLFIRKIYYLPRSTHTMCHECGTKKSGYGNARPVRTWQTFFSFARFLLLELTSYILNGHELWRKFLYDCSMYCMQIVTIIIFYFKLVNNI